MPVANNADTYKYGSSQVDKVYLGSNAIWENFAPIVATGGNTVSDVTINGRLYRVHTYSSVGTSTFNVTDPGTESKVEYLVLAGGAGGAPAYEDSLGASGGGGAGGYRTNVVGDTSGSASSAEPEYTVSAGAITVTVGAGGNQQANGANSVFGNIVSIGGGRGNRRGGGSAGGSGGGGASLTNFIGGQGTSGQGSRGENGYNGGYGGHGGGAGVAFSTNAFNGRTGLASNITGTTVRRAGGGGGGARGPWGGTVDGSGWCDPGWARNGNAAVANSGAGGGGASDENDASRSGGAGGSGIVIIRYPLEAA